MSWTFNGSGCTHTDRDGKIFKTKEGGESTQRINFFLKQTRPVYGICIWVSFAFHYIMYILCIHPHKHTHTPSLTHRQKKYACISVPWNIQVFFLLNETASPGNQNFSLFFILSTNTNVSLCWDSSGCQVGREQNIF